MRLSALFFSAAFAILPGLALAGPMGCSGDHSETQAMSCVEGTVWDEASSACIPQTTS